MLNRIILWSIKHRLVVIIGAAVLLVYGGVVAARSPVDVFPDLTAPTVTILTESHGMAPEEVESLVSLPIERPQRPLFASAPIEPDVQTNTIREGRLYLIVLDSLHVSPFNVPRVKMAIGQHVSEDIIL